MSNKRPRSSTITYGCFTIERLSQKTYKVVQDDGFGQYPFAYAILGADKIVVIDTLVGRGGFRRLLDRYVNPQRLPYVVICTHVHFDHIGHCYEFQRDKICMGNANPKTSMNIDLFSLCCAHGTTVRPFTVHEWLADGATLHLDDAAPTAANRLTVLHTPGHTLDSVSVYLHAEKRLFVGDLLYPFTAISLSALGSAPKDYTKSLRRLTSFLIDQHVDEAAQSSSGSGSSDSGGGSGGSSSSSSSSSSSDDGGGGATSRSLSSTAALSDPPPAPAPPPAADKTPPAEMPPPPAAATTAAAEGTAEGASEASADVDDRELMFALTIGLEVAELRRSVDALHLVRAICDGDLEAAINLYLSDQALAVQIAPPRSSSTSASSSGSSSSSSSGSGSSGGSGSSNADDDVVLLETVPSPPGHFTLACGHVDAALDALGSIEQVLALCDGIGSGAVTPCGFLEDDVCEYSDGMYTIVAPRNVAWN